MERLEDLNFGILRMLSHYQCSGFGLRRMRQISFSPGTEVEVYLDRHGLCDVWFPAAIISTIKKHGQEACLVQFKSRIKSLPLKSVVDPHQVRLAPPSSADKYFQILENVDAFCDGGWSSGVVTKILAEGRYIVFLKRTKKEKEFSGKELRVHMECINGKWFHSSQGADNSRAEFPETHTPAVTCKRRWPSKSKVKSPRAFMTDAAAAEDSLDSGCIKRTERTVLVVGLASNGEKRSSQVTSCGQLPKDEPFKEKEQEDFRGSAVKRKQEDVRGSTVKRKRGRPPKLQAGSPKTPGAAEPAGTHDAMPSGTHKIHAEHQSGRVCGNSVKSRAKNLTGKKERRWKIATGVRSSAQDSKDASEEKVTEVATNGSTEGAIVVAALTSSNASDDDRPLSAWFEGAHSSQSAMDETRITPDGLGHHSDEGRERADSLKLQSPVHPNQEEKDDQGGVAVEDNDQHDDAREREDEAAIQSEVTIHMDDPGILDSNEDLPFVKSSLLWRMIESMEVFQRIPQKPHFNPLYDKKKECREGLAIGNMVTFASLVANISKFRFEDPRTLLDSSMEALVDLENFGFNVNPVKERLQLLISSKDRHEEALNSSKDFGTQIMERNNEKLKINEEIEELDMQIDELKQKRALFASLQERKDSEIAILQSSVDALKGSLEGAGGEFQRVASAPW